MRANCVMQMKARVVTPAVAMAVLMVALTVPGPRAQAPAQEASPEPVNAMIITGGCCHDYTGQTKMLMDTVNAVMPVNWTVVHGVTSLREPLSLFSNPNWADAYDIVVHNECWAGLNLPDEIVRNITTPDVARMFIHCAFHSYRVMDNDGWRELMGGTSRRHTQAHNIALTWAPGHPITDGLPPFVTPIDELYVIEQEWPPFTALATAVSPEEDNPTFPVVWTHEHSGSRIFSTTLGHGNDTWNTNQFQELLVRGFRWAVNVEPVAPPAPPDTGRGGGRGRGAGRGGGRGQ